MAIGLAVWTISVTAIIFTNRCVIAVPNVDLPACADCSGRPDVPCRVQQMTSPSCYHGEFEDQWPGAPRKVKAEQVAVHDGKWAANFTWKPPYDQSISTLTGFFLTVQLVVEYIDLQMPVGPYCFYSNLTGTNWSAVSNPHAVVFHFDCISASVPTNVQLLIQSSPLPNREGDYKAAAIQLQGTCRNSPPPLASPYQSFTSPTPSSYKMEQLARHGGEEAMVVTANITEGTLNHLGTTHTRGFLDDREDFKGQFLKYCIKSGDVSIVDHHGSLAPEGRESLVNLGQYTNSFQSHIEKQSNVIQHIQFQDGRAASYLSTIQPCVTAPADSHIQKRKHQDSFAGTGISAPTSTKQSCPSRTCETVPPSVSNLVNARHVPVLTFDSPAETMPVKKESLDQYNSSNYMLIHQPQSLEHLTGGIEPQSNVASSSDSDMAAEYGEAVVKIEVDDGYIDTETGMVDTCDDVGSDYTGKYDQSDNTATSSSAVTHECTISDKKPSDTTSRFKSLSEEELASYEVSTTVQSRSTMKNTKWGLKLFQDWHVDIFGEPLDTNTVSTECLVEKLRKFYCEARPKESHSRASKFSASSVEMYHKNTLRNIRAAINRHLNDIGRDLDIVQDRDFKPANRALEGLVRSGLVQVTTHTEQMSDEDLRKIMLYFKDATVSPVVLRHCVIFHVAVNFSTSMDFMYMLKLDSFNFEMDDIGNEYVMLSEETQAKVLESGIVKSRSIIQKRMYGTSHADNEESCPLKMLKLLQNKTHPCAKSLFNRFVRETSLIDTWYCAKPLAKRSFAVFLQDICKQANCSRTYTAQALQFGGTWLS